LYSVSKSTQLLTVGTTVIATNDYVFVPSLSPTAGPVIGTSVTFKASKLMAVKCSTRMTLDNVESFLNEESDVVTT